MNKARLWAREPKSREFLRRHCGGEAASLTIPAQPTKRQPCQGGWASIYFEGEVVVSAASPGEACQQCAERMAQYRPRNPQGEVLPLLVSLEQGWAISEFYTKAVQDAA